MKEKSILETYLMHHDKYALLYGNNMVVLMEVGGFFEMYGVQTNETHLGPDLQNICELLNIQLSRRDKSETNISKDNWLMAGFPSHALKKFVDILINANFTVVLVEQTTPPPNPKRDVTEILSPSTYVDNVKSYESANMMVAYFEESINWKTKIPYLVLGWSVLDVSTGTSWTNEITNINDNKILLDELHRLLLIHKPTELVLLSNEMNMIFDEEKIEWLIKTANLDVVNCVHNFINKLNNCFTLKTYQEQLLSKVYTNNTHLTTIELLDLEFKKVALTSFTYLLQFAYEHSETNVKNIKKPIIFEDLNDNTLLLANNCIFQLNIDNYGRSIQSYNNNKDMDINNLVNILNKCHTSVGKRYFKKCLLCPLNEVEVIEDRYAKTDFMLNTEFWNIAGKNMNTILDIERLIRKIGMKRLNPCEFVSLFKSLEHLNIVISKLFELPNSEIIFKDIQNHDIISDFNSFVIECNNTINIEQAYKYNFENVKTSIFRENIYKDIDDMMLIINEKLKWFEELSAYVNELDHGNCTNWLKMEYNERDGHHYTITSKRLSALLKIIECRNDKTSLDNRILQFKSIKLTANSTNNVKVVNDSIRKNSNELIKTRCELKTKTIQYFNEFLEFTYGKYYDYFLHCVSCLETVDYHMTCAKNAKIHNHIRPKIDRHYMICDYPSYIDVKNLRHPIIEEVNKKIMYTPNSLQMGKNDEKRGMLLYGVNSSGKSSFMKSIGIAIIMAQAGMYVAASELTYVPYSKIFTRIQSSDNIFKGMSTFAVEISELRNILKRSDSRSLIIGDELCSGTESVSGMAIIAAGMKMLCDNKSTFIFTTHLHELTNIDMVNELIDETKLMVKHLSVRYDYQHKKLVYDRLLQDGKGDELYGLEVCKAADLDKKFLHLAGLVRNSIIDRSKSILTSKNSRYNSNVIVDECKICKNKDNIEVHHINHQKDASQDGMINNQFHKNIEHNLVVLCNDCHDLVHENKITINGWKETEQGIILDYIDHHTDNMKRNKKNSEAIEGLNRSLILKIRSMNSLKKTIEILKIKHNIEISEYKLKKFIETI